MALILMDLMGESTRVARVSGERNLGIHMKAVRRTLSSPWIERTLYVLGSVLLGAWLAVQVDARLYYARHHELLVASRSLPASAVPDSAAPRSVIGLIEIPRLGLSSVVAEGTDAISLFRAVGHLPGTPFPGRPGNVVLAGHRDTYFRPLAAIAEDDTIRITTPYGRYAYQVTGTQIVPPSRTDVLAASPSPMLTLVTCYPFRYVGRAPLRFIVQAAEIPVRSGR